MKNFNVYEKYLTFLQQELFQQNNHFVPNKTKDTLYVFFPRFRACYVTQEKSFFQILSHPSAHECGIIIYENLLIWMGKTKHASWKCLHKARY